MALLAERMAQVRKLHAPNATRDKNDSPPSILERLQLIHEWQRAG